MDWIMPLLTLTAMEVVLGIDNIIFIAILVARLPEAQQGPARKLGLGLALITRILLLLSLTWVMRLTDPVFKLSDLGLPAAWFSEKANQISWKDLILIGGGLFLIAKSTHEIYMKVEGHEESATGERIRKGQFGWTLVQIALLDIIFSLDSVITAIGMANQLWVMVLAVILAVGIMLVFSGAVSGFVHRHPSIRVLALSFLILIGVMLVAEGFEKEIERGYIYFAMCFSLVVELLNIRAHRQAEKIKQ